MSSWNVRAALHLPIRAVGTDDGLMVDDDIWDHHGLNEARA